MKLIKKNSKRGFTLVELVIVIAILAVLALILVPAISKYVGNAELAKNQASARIVYSSAVSELAMNPEFKDSMKEVSYFKAVKEASNITDGEVKVELDANKQVKYIEYTPKDATVSIYYDGKGFEKTKD